MIYISFPDNESVLYGSDIKLFPLDETEMYSILPLRRKYGFVPIRKTEQEKELFNKIISGKFVSIDGDKIGHFNMHMERNKGIIHYLKTSYNLEDLLK